MQIQFPDHTAMDAIDAGDHCTLLHAEEPAVAAMPAES
jgi:hypothetical protein